MFMKKLLLASARSVRSWRPVRRPMLTAPSRMMWNVLADGGLRGVEGRHRRDGRMRQLLEAELDQEFRTKQPAAFAANPSLYQIGGVSNGTITPLLNEGTIRPLDDLVEKYGQNLTPNQLIKIDGRSWPSR
jgi:hypothetical protein